MNIEQCRQRHKMSDEDADGNDDYVVDHGDDDDENAFVHFN